MLLERIEKHISFEALKEDLRKIGINFVTAGTVGLFVTHIAGLTLLVVGASIWVIITGLIASFLGLYRRNKS